MKTRADHVDPVMGDLFVKQTVAPGASGQAGLKRLDHFTAQTYAVNVNHLVWNKAPYCLSGMEMAGWPMSALPPFPV